MEDVFSVPLWTPSICSNLHSPTAVQHLEVYLRTSCFIAVLPCSWTYEAMSMWQAETVLRKPLDILFLQYISVSLMAHSTLTQLLLDIHSPKTVSRAALERASLSQTRIFAFLDADCHMKTGRFLQDPLSFIHQPSMVETLISAQFDELLVNAQDLDKQRQVHYALGL